MTDAKFDAIRDALDLFGNSWTSGTSNTDAYAAVDAAEEAYFKLSELRAEQMRMAKRIIVLDREPRKPSGGGMSTGDMISVRDTRLASAIAIGSVGRSR